MDGADFLVTWDNGENHIVSQTHLLPDIQNGSIVSYVPDISWICKIIHLIDDENIVVRWHKDKKKNTLSLTDICVTESAKNVYWRYDRSWKGTATLMKTSTEGGSVGNSGIQYQKRRRNNVMLVTDYDASDGEESATGSELESNGDELRLSELESDSEENIPVAVFSPQRRVERKDGVLWRICDDVLPYPEFVEPRSRDIHVRTPFAYFQDYYNESFMDLVCHQSNLYATQINPNSTFVLDHNLYRRFTSVTLFMSLFSLTCSRRFWSTAGRLALVADCIPRKEFELVKRHLQFTDNDQYRETPLPGYKFKPLIDHFNMVCQDIPKTEKMSIDEQILPTKTKKSKLRQYNPKKPKKWGFKIFMITDPSGIVYKIEFYLGKRNDSQNQLGASGAVVMRLAEIVPKHANHKLFFDNWFSSLELLQRLRENGIFALATFNTRRMPSLEFPTDSEMKKTGRGTMIEKQCVVNQQIVSATKWFDNRGVHLVSNFVGSQPVTKIKRYDRLRGQIAEFPCPAAIKEYNAFMGGIDAFDSYISLYRTKIRSTRKYYLRIYFHIIDMMVINSWLLYCKDSLQTGASRGSLTKLWDFKYEIAMTLSSFHQKVKRPRFSNVSAGILVKRKRGPTAAMLSIDVRQDGVDHLPLTKERGRCKKPGCKSVVKTYCSKCNVHLCISENNCFYSFHTE